MEFLFTVNEVSLLFEYALQYGQIDAAGLALKAAQTINAHSSTFLSKAVENCVMWEPASSSLIEFALYNQIDVIIELLQSNSTKVKVIAILSLQKLGDPRALEPLNKLMHESEDRLVSGRAATAYKTIAEKPVALQNNPSNTCRQLTPLNEEDLALADFILNRDLSNKEVS
jgi:HEAT repeat protein